MDYQITFVGVWIIAIYSTIVFLLIVRPLARGLGDRVLQWTIAAPIAVVLLAAPWAEEYWIASRFEEACKDAGVHVYKQVEVDGFVDATSVSQRPEVSSTDPKLLYNDAHSLAKWDRDLGYRFKETLLSDGGVWHVERYPDGVYYSVLDNPIARYHFKYAYQPSKYVTTEQVGWKMEKLEYLVVDSEKEEILGRETKYRRYLSIQEGSWRKFWGGGQGIMCEGSAPQPPVLRQLLYRYVLIPTKNR